MGRGIYEGSPRTERVQLETRSSDPTNPSNGEAWLRTDLTDTDKVGEFRFWDGSSVQAVDVVTPGSTGAGAEEVLRVQTPSGIGVIPMYPRDDAGYPEFSLQHAGQVLGMGVLEIPDVGDQQWTVGDGSGTTLTPRIGTVTATVDGATWQSDSSAVDGYHLSLDGTDDHVVTDSNVGARKSQFTAFGWFRPQDYTAFGNALFSAGPTPGSGSGGWYLTTTGTDGELSTVQAGGSNLGNIPFVSAGNWGFIAYLMDGNNQRVITFDNSQELADTNSDGNSRSIEDAQLNVGAVDGSDNFADADLDFFGVADGRLLSKSEIVDLWESTQR